MTVQSFVEGHGGVSGPALSGRCCQIHSPGNGASFDWSASTRAPNPSKCTNRPIPQLEDVTAKSGITFTHTSSKEKKYIFESMTGGVIIFDYDRDGWPDIYFTNAPTVDMALKGQTSFGRPLPQQSRRHLHRRNAKIGTDQTLPGHGWCGRRLRQRRLARSVHHLPRRQHPLPQQRRWDIY